MRKKKIIQAWSARLRVAMFGSLCAAATLTASAILAAPAHAANWWEMNTWLSGPRYSGAVPACDTSFALGLIKVRFWEKEFKFWNSNLSIVGFANVQETAYRPWASNTIPRRFCTALAQLSDGAARPVHYSIGEDTGIAGAVWGVEWCVTGLDRNWSYNPQCKMAQP